MKEICKALEKLSEKYKIMYAVVFGSYGSKTQWKESDIDIGLKLKESPKNFRENLKISTKISEDLGKILKREVDVIILNSASLGLKFEIFETGKVVFYKSKHEFLEDKTNIIANYHDFRFFIEPLYKKLVSRYERK